MIDIKDSRWQNAVNKFNNLLIEVNDFSKIESVEVKKIIGPTYIGNSLFDTSKSINGYEFKILFSECPEFEYTYTIKKRDAITIKTKHGYDEYGIDNTFEFLCRRLIPSPIHTKMQETNYFERRVRLNKIKQVL